jgi:hypothetical protein
MITLVAHLTEALVIVLAFFFAIRCLFAHEKRLAAWHAPFHSWFHMEPKGGYAILSFFGLFTWLYWIFSMASPGSVPLEMATAAWSTNCYILVDFTPCEIL